MIRLTSVVILSLFLSIPTLGVADDSPKDGRPIQVGIRMVEARDPITHDPQSIAIPFSLDSRLEDLREKLKKLQFRTFRLLGEQSESVPLMKKEAIVLVNGDHLFVRPLYVSDHRVGMWLEWQGLDGMEVLNTRMHFDAGESMITGTESTNGKGMVLAIQVSAE